MQILRDHKPKIGGAMMAGMAFLITFPASINKRIDLRAF